MNALKLIRIGNPLGVVLPKEVLARLKLTQGDVLHLTETPGGIALTPDDPQFDEQVERGREFMRDFRDTFRALAK